MSEQGKRLRVFLIQLMFSDNQAEKIVVKNFFTNEILCRHFFPDKVELKNYQSHTSTRM